jgi:uncharacterized protein (TIGR04222 family)
MSLFDLSEVDFLTLYAGVIAAGLALALLLRWALRTPGATSGDPPALNPYEVAYLSGGPVRAVHAALAALVHTGRLTLGVSTGRLYREADLPPEAHPLERALYSVEPGTMATRVADMVGTETRPIGAHLEAIGLLLSDVRSNLVRWVTGLLLVVVALLGIARVTVELTQHKRPVNVGLLTAVPVAAVALAFFKRPDRSRRGDQVLGLLRQRNEELAEAARTRWDTLSDQDVALVVGVFGPGVLTAGPLGRLRTVLNAPETADEGLPLAPPSDSE